MKREVLSGIYQYSFKYKDKKYIGSSINLDKRNKQHISYLKNGYHSITSFQNDFNTFGIENLEYCIIEIVDNTKYLNKKITKKQFQKELFNIEQKYLDEYFAQEYIRNNNDLRFFKLLYNKSVLANITKLESSVSREKQVNKFNLNGEFIDSFYNSEVASLCCNIDASSIKKACYGQRKSAGGFIWSYKSSVLPYQNKTIKKINQYDLNKKFIASFMSIKEAYRKTGIDVRKEKNSLSITHGGFYWLFDNEDFPKRNRQTYDPYLIEECKIYTSQSHKYGDRLNFCKEMSIKYNAKLSIVQGILSSKICMNTINKQEAFSP